MNTPRVPTLVSLSEVSALRRLRGGFYGDLAPLLSGAMEARTRARVENGSLAKRFEALLEMGSTPLEAVSALLLEEAQEVASLMRNEAEREAQLAAQAEEALSLVAATRAG